MSSLVAERGPLLPGGRPSASGRGRTSERHPTARASRPSAPPHRSTNGGAPLGVCCGEPAIPALIAARSDCLGRYSALAGTQPREVIAIDLRDASVLVIDCRAHSRSDARLVARIAPDEPRENARILCGLYLADATRGRCRPLTAPDLQPSGSEKPVSHAAPPAERAGGPWEVIHGDARTFAVRTIITDAKLPQLRWTSLAADGAAETVTLRDLIGRLESYQPALAITIDALADHAGLQALSTSVLRCELERVQCSPIVLNRGLREAVQRHVAQGVTMSEIAIRCGRRKRDRRGTLSGETSWLARRTGQMPEAGRAEPTPWVHSSTLALIARDGLALNPNEVEL